MIGVSLSALLVWATLLYLCGLVLGQRPQSRGFKLILAPGIYGEAVTRAIAGLLTGTKIKGFYPFRPGKPVLECGPTPIPHIGPPLNLLIRLTLLYAAAFYSMYMLTEVLHTGFSLPLLDEAALENGEIRWHTPPEFWRMLLNLPADIKLHRYSGALIAYGLFTHLIASSLSHKEALTSLYLVGTLALLGAGANWIGLGFSWFSRGDLIVWYLNSSFWSTLSILIVATLINLVILTAHRFLARPTLALLKPNKKAKKETDYRR